MNPWPLWTCLKASPLAKSALARPHILQNQSVEPGSRAHTCVMHNGECSSLRWLHACVSGLLMLGSACILLKSHTHVLLVLHE